MPYAGTNCFNGTKLLKLRYDKRLSLSQLETEVGVAKNTLWIMENNNCKNPSFEVVARLAEFFNCTMEDFKLRSLL